MEVVTREADAQAGASLPPLEVPLRIAEPAGRGSHDARVARVFAEHNYSPVVSIPKAAVTVHSAALEAVGIASLLLLNDFEHATWESKKPWKAPSAEELADVLGASPSQVYRALAVARQFHLLRSDWSIASWPRYAEIPRGAARIDARRLGYAGLAILAALSSHVAVTPLRLSFALGLNLTCSQVYEAVDTLTDLGYIDSEWRPVAGK